MTRWLTRDRIVPLAIVLLTIIAYFPAFRAGWIWDDDYYVTSNANLQDLDGLGRTWARLGLPNGGTPQYYPLVHTTFWVEHKLYADSPAGYHIDNVLLHALSAVLLWRLLETLAIPGAAWAAMLWAVHPVNVESVAWVTERKNVLSGVFYFAALLVYFTKPGGQLYWTRYIALLVLFVAALLSKTTTATLPAAILVILWWKYGRLTRRDIWPMLPLVAIGAALGSLTGYVERHYVGAQGPEWDLSPWQRILTVGRAPWFYFAKIIWPFDLAFVYDKWTIDPSTAWQWLFPAATAALAIALYVFRDRVGRGALAAWLLFCGTLFPALGFVSVYPFRYSYVADHFQYLACAAVLALIAAALTRYPAGRALIGVAVLLLAALTSLRATVFRDAQTLWTATIATNPNAWMARNNLAGIFIARGNYAAAQEQLDEVRRHWGNAPEVHVNLGQLAEAQGDDATAQREYQEAIRLGGTDTTPVYDLARLFEKHGNAAQAETLYRQVLAASPGHPMARGNLGKILAETGRTDEAETLYREEIAINPQSVVARVNWAQLKLARRDYDAARRLVADALAIDPDNAVAINTLGAIYGSQGSFAAAEELFRDAIASRERFPEAHSNLARVLAAKGDVAAARREYERALEIDPKFAPALAGLHALEAK